MNNIGLDYISENINELISKIEEKKSSIKILSDSIKKKQTNIFEIYTSKMQELDSMDSKIKATFDNKYFRYIKHIDFLNQENIELTNFSISKTLGCLVKAYSSRIEVPVISKKVSSDKRIITFEFNEEYIANQIEYEFYDDNLGEPIYPLNIFLYYQDNKEELYEPFFRFYNNSSTTFKSDFYLSPKKIKKIEFVFDNQISTSRCKLFSNLFKNSYTEDEAVIKIENNKLIKTFNLFKTTHEPIPLEFSYSEDKINYLPIAFNQNTGLIELKNDNDFYIKIQANYDESNNKTKNVAMNDELNNLELTGSMGVYNFNSYKNIENIEIVIPTSTKKELMKYIKPEDEEKYFVTNSGVCKLNQELVNLTTEAVPEYLKYLDDIAELEKDNSLLSVFFDKTNYKLHVPEFLSHYSFFIKINYKIENIEINSNYNTPIIFELSLKG